MSDRLPVWLERWLGVDSSAPGEGTLWRLEHAWRLAPWVTLLLIAMLAGYIVWLYSWERRSAGRWARGLLAGLRIAALGIVLWMLAAWMLSLQRSGLPYTVVLIDDSASMATVDQYHDDASEKAVAKYRPADSSAPASRLDVARSILTANDARALKRMSAEQRLRLYAISSAARRIDGDLQELTAQLSALEPAGEWSRLGNGIDAVLDDLRGTPPAAIVLMSDGVNTAGTSLADAAQLARRKGVPLYTVAIGSSEPVRDTEISDLLVDEVVFINDVVNFEFTVTASGYAQQGVAAQLVDVASGNVLAETPLTLAADGVPERARIAYRPTEEGELELAVRIAPQSDEADAENNAASRTLQVRKDKLRVLMVWWQPSLEFRRLKALLERESTIDLKTVLQDADLEYAESDKTALKVFPADRDELRHFDVVLFGDAHPDFLGALALDLLRDFVSEKGGGLAVVAGPRFTPRAYAGRPLEKLLPVDLDPTAGATTAPATEGFVPRLTDLGAASPGCQIADTLSETTAVWEALPPWFWFEPAARARPGARVLLEHPTRLGADGRPLPLVALQFVGAGKVLYQATDESYRWRFRVGDLYFGRYWVQMIRYLGHTRAADEDRIAEIIADRREYRRGESPRLHVRFTDDRQTPTAGDGVSLVVERQGQRVQTLALASGATPGSFEGTLQQPAEGKYRVWLSAPASPGKPPSVEFRVTPPPGETERIETDVAELQRVATLTKGKFYTLANVEQLWRELPSGRQIPVETLPPVVLWNQWPVLALVITLLITEWLLRKRKGLL
ncbi:MAG: VWA domain-containing protein [Planctomycetia bacterium]|nr:VWA domain-containing protein [Planctomycetia bacterium]